MIDSLFGQFSTEIMESAVLDTAALERFIKVWRRASFTERAITTAEMLKLYQGKPVDIQIYTGS